MGQACLVGLNSGVFFTKGETVGSDLKFQENVLGAVEGDTVLGSLLLPEVTVSVATPAAKHDMWQVLASRNCFMYLVSPSYCPLLYTP